MRQETIDYLRLHHEVPCTVIGYYRAVVDVADSEELGHTVSNIEVPILQIRVISSHK